MSGNEPSAVERTGGVREGQPHPNDLGVTPSTRGDLYLVAPDLTIHRANWSSTVPRNGGGLGLPRRTVCGQSVAGDWKFAAGFPRRAICGDCGVR